MQSNEVDVAGEVLGRPSPDYAGRSCHAYCCSIPEVATFSRVCAYDRPGTASPGPNDQVVAGTSTPVRQPVTEANGVDELGKMVVSRVQLVPGITRTLTCSVVHL